MPNFENRKVAGVRSVQALEAGSTVDSDTMKVAGRTAQKTYHLNWGEIVGGLLSGPPRRSYYCAKYDCSRHQGKA